MSGRQFFCFFFILHLEMRGLSICQSRPCRIEPFEPGDGGARKYAILARRGNDILKLLRPVGLSKCTACGHGVRTGAGFVEAWNGIRRASCHSFFVVRCAPFRRKTSRVGISFFYFQGFFPPACRERCPTMRTKKMFSQPNEKSFDCDWNVFRLKKS